MGPLSGISHAGSSAEDEFCRLTGATKSTRREHGDVVLDGHYVEIKNANGPTLNQVRAVKYIPLAARSRLGGCWYVVPANEVVRRCARKLRGQHGENPFETATLSTNNLREFAVQGERDLKSAVLDAIKTADQFPELRELMQSVSRRLRTLADTSREEADQVLRELHPCPAGGILPRSRLDPEDRSRQD